MPINREKTPGELAADHARKQQRHNDRIQVGVGRGWRLTNSKTECFLLDEMAPEEAFLEFTFVRETQLGVIFRKFVTDEIIAKIFNSLGSPIIMGTRMRNGHTSPKT